MEKAVIFDMDGVIFDSERLYIKYSMITAKLMGYEMDYDFGLSLVGVGADAVSQKLIEKYGQSFPKEKFGLTVYENYKKGVFSGELKLKKGINEILEYLKNKGYSIGLASSTFSKTIKWQLEHYKLIGYFDYIIGGEEVVKNKPSPECYIKCIKKLNVLPENTYIIEDSYDGVRAGYLAKAKVVMVPDLLLPNRIISNFCVYVAQDLFAVIEYLERNITNKN